jgi:hypothetical protein
MAPLFAYADPRKRETTYRLLRSARQARDLYRVACDANNEPLGKVRRAEFLAAQDAANAARRDLYGIRPQASHP